MSLATGTRLGPYEILSALGAGGMGEVYRARDTKLNREVAIKVLLPAVANDPDRLARFTREAHVLASLNHPNIAHIHGLEESNGVTALVMELVEGEDLSQRLQRGALPIAEALPIARQIAEALEAAHDLGIIHRDLKPANIKLRPDGAVKVLDFGLAKAIDRGSAIGDQGSALANSPTLSIHATQAGIILGTAAYMSPEQAAGKPVDKRSDLWAFGVVLLEMLTGRQVFKGETVSHVIAAVLKDDPNWSELPHETPASVRRLLRRCLNKDRKLRLPDAAVARLEIDEANGAFQEQTGPLISKPRQRTVVGGAFVAGTVLIGAAWVLTGALASTPPGAMVRFAIHDTDRITISRAGGDMALSPDGLTLAFVGNGDGGKRIWIRPLDSQDARPVSGTTGAAAVTWSPDGRWLAFTADGRVKKTAVAGGTPETVTPSGRILGNSLAWGTDGTILYTSSQGFWRVPSSGGVAQRVVPRVTGEGHALSGFLPDGRHYLAGVTTKDPATTGTFVATLDGATRARLLPFAAPARYAMGHLLFVRDLVLYAQPFDLSSAQLSGEALPIAENVAATFGVSGNTLAYLPTDASGQSDFSQLQWIDRTGKVLDRIEGAAGAGQPNLSPDARRLAMRMRGGVWIMDLERRVLSRLLTGGNAPTWLPDGRRLMIHRSGFQNGKDFIFEKPIGVTSAETVIREPDGEHAHPTDVSSDGRYLIYEGESTVESDVWVAELTGSRTVRPYVQTPSTEVQGTLSPDDRWLAYTSNVSGSFEIYVQSFPEPGAQIQVSANGGSQPRWGRDGTELFYLAPDDTLMAVPVRSTQPLEFGPPKALFQVFTSQIGAPAQIPPFDVTPDGQRFIVSVVVRRDDPSVHLLLNWPAMLKARAAQ
jgi:Tol biopolymer transport system component